MEGLKEGIAKGKIEGKQEGVTETLMKTANRMNDNGFDIKDIIKATGLSEEELNEAGIGD